MHIQIEITTICNYGCFYCAGRDMPQQHMSMELFKEIIRKLPENAPHRISLQGEGEPTLHPGFWDMVEMVTELGHVPYTITNGTRLNFHKVFRYFPRIGISIDTYDPAEAERIKRYNLAKVLRNVETLLETYDPWRIIIHTVDYGQDIQPLKDYLDRQGITKHVVQPLQIKDDYAGRYETLVSHLEKNISYRCGFVTAEVMKYYNLQGIEMPCCYIKNTEFFVSSEHIRKSLAKKVVPKVCQGCRELYEGEEMSRVFLI